MTATAALVPEVAARQALEAAVARILAAERNGWVFRSPHRSQHLDEIERALTR